MSKDSHHPSVVFDIIVVGGGIVGLATAYALQRRVPGLRLLVVEKERGVARHQTGHNSGVLHTGLYYRPGSEKAKNCTQGRSVMVEFCEREGIAYEICGKVVVASDEGEVARLDELERRGRENDVRVERIGPDLLREIESEAQGVAALHVPEAGVVDFVAVAERLRAKIEAKGASVLLETEVLALWQERVLWGSRTASGAASVRPGSVVVETSRGAFRTRHVINCAGLQSDRVAGLAHPNPEDLPVRIVPFRGEYFEVVGAGRDLIRHLIYPVPDPAFPFLGVHFTRGISGEVEAGPSAVLNLGREVYGQLAIDPNDLLETLTFSGFWRLASQHARAGFEEVRRSLSKELFWQSAKRLVPALKKEHLAPGIAGIRAQAVYQDGRLVDDFLFEQSREVTSVLNAPSPAATASLVIGEKVAERALAAID